MKYDHFLMLPERAFQPRNGRAGMTLEGGGGGGPTTSTVTQSSIPEWLRPQTESLLGAATQEIFNTQFNPATGGYDIVGTKGYTPYSTDPSDYVAGFTPQEQAVFGEAAQMQSPIQFGQASQMTGQAGMGGFETAGQAVGYGGMGAGYGAQAAGMGGLYEQMATSPEAMAAYMSPYQQNVVDITKRQAISDAQKGQLGANLAAARQGTYGGGRQAVLQAEREAALQTNLADIQTKGMQDAFDRAQQAQQFGITSGLQGFQTGIQGAQAGLQGVQGAQAGYGLAGQMAGQLADIGAAGQASDISRMGFQQQMGAMPREMEQRMIDQAIQDYAMGELAPQQNLAFYNSLLRGFSTPVTTTSSYQAQPNPASQAAGLLAAGYGATQMGKKAGGVIKYAEGGITDVNALEGMAEDLSIPQLQQSMQSGSLPKYIGMPILENEVAKAERAKMAQAMMAQGQQQSGPSISDALMAKADQLQGITAVAEPVMAAGGGMVAFEQGGPIRFQDRGLVNPRTFLDYQNVKKEIPASVMRQAQQIAAKNPGITVGRALGILGYGAGAAGVAGAGLMATDALMSTDKGGRTVTGETPGYDYFTEEMISGITPGSAGPRTAQSGLEAAGEIASGVGSSLFSALAPTGYQAAQDEARIAEAAAGRGPDVERNSAAPAKADARRQEMIKAQAAAAPKPAATQPSAPPAAQKMPSTGDLSPEEFKRRQKAFGISDDPDADLRKQIADMSKGTKEDREQAKYRALIAAGLGMASGKSANFLENLTGGAQAGFGAYGQDIKDIKAEERDIMKMRGELARAEDARKRGDFKAYMDAEDKARKYDLDLAAQKTRDRMADIQAQYSAGRLSAEQARNQTAQARLGLLQQQTYAKARKQFMDEGGEAKIRDEFEKRFGKNWIKDPKLAQSFNQQMDAQIKQLAMMDTGLPSAEDLLGD